MFFSIIIPIYNAEKTLERCLDSICTQEFQDYEVLLIDDGSKDNSAAICEIYASKNTRFKLFRQENKGPSAARNEGLRHAEGAYLCFIDSDDAVLPEYLSQIYERIKNSNAEIVFIGYHKVDQEGRILATCIPPEGLSGFALLAELSLHDMFGYAWIKCISRKCVKDTFFMEDMYLFEDETFICSIIKKTCSFTVLPEALYCYVCDGDSMLTGKTYNNYCELSDRVFSSWECIVQAAPELKDFIEQKANYFVDRCRYYGFERDVSIRPYFESLAGTRFFLVHTKWTRQDQFIRQKNWLMIRMSKFFYRLKNRIRIV